MSPERVNVQENLQELRCGLLYAGYDRQTAGAIVHALAKSFRQAGYWEVYRASGGCEVILTGVGISLLFASPRTDLPPFQIDGEGIESPVRLGRVARVEYRGDDSLPKLITQDRKLVTFPLAYAGVGARYEVKDLT